ncbi:hypothetical protein ANN_13594 [Periplaneta americana]|uniref:Uncharacterized protein n=1 Tax=Periplaneta americana TaxID=6978 RepID=A0ABQ8TJU8_PERAM|nr:hypothetical protein ANN_13594 [Periplaneta americana]
MCKVAQVFEGVPVGEIDGVCVCDIPLFKYACLTSCDVERSFSQYKSLFRDNRHAFVMENLEMNFVVHCNSRPTTSTELYLIGDREISVWCEASKRRGMESKRAWICSWGTTLQAICESTRVQEWVLEDHDEQVADQPYPRHVR